MTLGVFALMTSELLPVGLLTPIGTALDLSEGTTALMVTVPGLVAAVAAPLVTVATARIDRRLVLALLGVPAGTLSGDLAGWRTAFAAVGVLGLISLACMVVVMPKLPPERTMRIADLPRVLRAHSALRVGIAMTFLVITGHFTAYTFPRPILQDDGVADGMIGMLSPVFGVAGICGNFLAGALVSTRLRQTVCGIGLLLAAAMAALAIDGHGVLSAAAVLVVWGWRTAPSLSRSRPGSGTPLPPPPRPRPPCTRPCWPCPSPSAPSSAGWRSTPPGR
ncbi:MFS transporter [Nonomuraea thailandensis]